MSELETIGLPTVVQKIAISIVKTIGAKRIRIAERPADLITTNSESRDKFIKVERPANIITKGIASIIIDGALSKVLFIPAEI